MVEQEGILAPKAPEDVNATGIDAGFLCDLALKAAHTVRECTTAWVAAKLHLPIPLVEDLLQQMKTNHLLDAVGAKGLFNNRYTVTGRGH